MLSQLRHWFLCCFLFANSVTAVVGQNQTSNWYFGENVGISFLNDTPEILTTVSLDASEGCSAYSDPASGAMRLYTDGRTVWNSSHEELLGGTGLIGGPSSIQASLIVPQPGIDELCYIFTTSDDQLRFSAEHRRGLRYSIADLSAAGGRGQVADATKNRLLLQDNRECVAAMYDCVQERYWIISLEFASNRFLAWELTDQGLDELPVISDARLIAADPQQSLLATLAFAPDGRSLALGVDGSVELFRFDPVGGTVSDAVVLRNDEGIQHPYYCLAFAPNSSQLYLTHQFKFIWQYDLRAGDAAAIRSSGLLIATQESDQDLFGGMQVGPDGRIYVAESAKTALSVIDKPERRGEACDFRALAFDLDGRRVRFGLPNFVATWLGPDAAMTSCPGVRARIGTSRRSICAGDAIIFTDVSFNEPERWQWSFAGGQPATSDNQNPGAVSFKLPGIYTVRLTVHKDVESDSEEIRIEVHPEPVADAGSDVTLCRGETSRLKAQGGLHYRWTPADGLDAPNSADPLASPDQSTTYEVEVRDVNGCMAVDRVTVSVINPPSVSLPPSYQICPGEAVSLEAVADAALSFSWEPADGLDNANSPTPTARPDQSTRYTLTVSNAECSASVSTLVEVRPVPELHIEGPAQLCRGELLQLRAIASEPLSYLWLAENGTQLGTEALLELNDAKAGRYEVLATTREGCKTGTTHILTIVEPPDLRLQLSSNLTAAAPNEIATMSLSFASTTTNVNSSAIQSLSVVLGLDLQGLKYRPNSIRPVGAGANWTFQAQEFSAIDELHVQGQGPALTSPGVLCEFDIEVYAGGHDSLFAPVYIIRDRLDINGRCFNLAGVSDGGLVLTDYCLRNLRRMRLAPSAYALRLRAEGKVLSVEYELAFANTVQISLYNNLGHLVSIVARGSRQAGTHSVMIPGLPAGLYLCRVRAGPYQRTESIVVWP